MGFNLYKRRQLGNSAEPQLPWHITDMKPFLKPALSFLCKMVINNAEELEKVLAKDPKAVSVLKDLKKAAEILLPLMASL